MVGTVPLDDGVVCLRPWTDADAHWYAAAVTRDTSIQRFTSEPADLTPERVRAALADLAERGDEAGFVVCDVATGERLGNIAASRTGEISYWLAATARGRGAATRALRLISAWAQDRWPGTDLLIWTHPGNTASQRVAERAGYRRNPALDRPRRVRGVEWDMLAYRLAAEPVTVEVPGVGRVHAGADDRGSTDGRTPSTSDDPEADRVSDPPERRVGRGGPPPGEG